MVAAGEGWSRRPGQDAAPDELLAKKAIAAKRDGRRYLYRPRINREDYA